LAAKNVEYSDGSHLLGYIFGYGWANGIDCAQRFSPTSEETIEFTFPTTLDAVLIGKEAYLPYGALSYCPMERVTLPSDSLEYISDYAFMGCTRLKTIAIPYSVKSLGVGVFKDCKALTEVTIGTSADKNNTTCLTVLPAETFYGCSSLTTLRALYNTNQKHVRVFDNIRELGDYVFYGCESIVRAYINDSITVIPAHAFDGCTNMVMFGDENNANAEGLFIESYITTLGDYAFSNCDAFTSIIVPSTITSFGTYVFSYSDGVESAELYTPVLPAGTFAYCSSIETAQILPSVTTVGASAFDTCRVFKNLIFEDDLTTTGIQLTNNITVVGSRAFYLCESVDELFIDEQVSILGSYCFYGMNFTEYEVPKTITRIDEGVFGGWSNLVDFTIPYVGQAKTRDEDGIGGVFGWMFGREQGERGIAGTGQYYDHSNGNEYSDGKNSATFYIPRTLRTLTITDAVALGGFALYDVNFITELNLPDTLTRINRHSIAYCRGLTSLVIPDSVTFVNEHALRGCSGLQEITLPIVGRSKGNTSGHQSTFAYIFGRNSTSGMSSLSNGHTTVYVPSGLTKVTVTQETYLSSTAFYNMQYIRELYISNKLETSEAAFRLMNNLRTLSIPFVGRSRTTNTTTSFGAQTSLLGYMFGTNSGNSISAKTQYYSATAYTNYYISNNLSTLYITDETVLGYGALMNIPSLTTIVLNDGLRIINDRAFEGCTGLTKMTLPRSIQTIETAIFAKCSNLEELTIPFVGHDVTDRNSTNNEFGRWFGTVNYTGSTPIEQVNGVVYYVPTKLTKVTITDALYLNDYAFYKYTLLNTINITSELEVIGNYCFYGCAGITEISIPNSVVEVGDSSFENCTSLTTVLNYEGISKIGNSMFKGCTALENFEFKSNIKIIGDSAFEDCTSLGLKEIIKPVYNAEKELWELGTPTPNYVSTIDLNEVEQIGDQAFRGCTGLVKVTLPEYINQIGEYSFENCTSLTTLVHNTDILGVGIFKGCTSLDNVVLNEGTLEVNDEAFMDCTGLKNITLSPVLQIIGDRAFMNTTALLEIELPVSLLSIGENAFKNSGLTYVVIPANVVTIGDYAFIDCEKLKKATFNNSVLGLGMFKNCTDLRNAYITIGVTVIPKEAFMNCEKLTLIT
ncbi:MAG: leucine-rich repeat domain-containing protein, partial [Anaeroplasmataceae bacterium]|nr:leucine-rich repeat domain-containing protein [Anaeroplasmataceae bacterium]